jgi:hypothetical protein
VTEEIELSQDGQPNMLKSIHFDGSRSGNQAMQKPADYAASGLDIQRAMVDQHRQYSGRADAPDHILWEGRPVKTTDWWQVPDRGIVRIDLLHARVGMESGVDVKLEDGWVELADGDRLPVLRTWMDERFEDTVEYPFFSRAGKFCVWNVSRVRYPGGQAVEEKWTGNAGFWVETVNDHHRIYHCSHSASERPDFDTFVFGVLVSPED